MSLEWRGPEVAERVRAASLAGIDETLAACVVTAKADYRPGHGLVTAALQGSVQMRPAEMQGDVGVGLWGSFDIDYAIYVEMGTALMAAQAQLRHAADQHYPSLAERIARRMRA